MRPLCGAWHSRVVTRAPVPGHGARVFPLARAAVHMLPRVGQNSQCFWPSAQYQYALEAINLIADLPGGAGQGPGASQAESRACEQGGEGGRFQHRPPSPLRAAKGRGRAVSSPTANAVCVQRQRQLRRKERKRRKGRKAAGVEPTKERLTPLTGFEARAHHQVHLPSHGWPAQGSRQRGILLWAGRGGWPFPAPPSLTLARCQRQREGGFKSNRKRGLRSKAATTAQKGEKTEKRAESSRSRTYQGAADAPYRV